MERSEVRDEVIAVLMSTLQIDGRRDSIGESTALLGSLPEFDSMAVVSVLTALEESYGFVIDDDEVEAETFETVGTLVDFVQAKLNH